MELRCARPRTRRHGESPVGDWRRRFHVRPRGFASAAAKSPSPPFGFRHAAGHERRPSPHTKTPAPRASRTNGTEWTVLPQAAFAAKACWLDANVDFVKFRAPRRRRSCPGAAKKPEWAEGTHRHRREDSVARRAKEEVSSRVAASPRGSAAPILRRSGVCGRA